MGGVNPAGCTWASRGPGRGGLSLPTSTLLPMSHFQQAIPTWPSKGVSHLPLTSGSPSHLSYLPMGKPRPKGPRAGPEYRARKGKGLTHEWFSPQHFLSMFWALVPNVPPSPASPAATALCPESTGARHPVPGWQSKEAAHGGGAQRQPSSLTSQALAPRTSPRVRGAWQPVEGQRRWQPKQGRGAVPPLGGAWAESLSALG